MGSVILGEAISAIRAWSLGETTEPRGMHAVENFGSWTFNDGEQQTLNEGQRTAGHGCFQRHGRAS